MNKIQVLFIVIVGFVILGILDDAPVNIDAYFGLNHWPFFEMVMHMGALVSLFLFGWEGRRKSW